MRYSKSIPGPAQAALLTMVVLVVGAVAAQAADRPAANSFLRSEYEVLGAQASILPAAVLAADQPEPERRGRAGEFDVQRDDETERTGGPSNLNRKVKAALLSAVLPGAGQWYNGDRTRAYWMGGVEVGIWGAFFLFDHQGDSWKDSATDYASIYAGTSGSHDEGYWISVGSYMNSDDYYDALDREARALGEDYPVPRDAGSWEWANNQRRQEFWRLWGDAHDAYDRRDYMYVFALVNRVVSMVDAVMGVDRVADGALGTRVLGLDMQLAVDPDLTEPGARWTFSRSF